MTSRPGPSVRPPLRKSSPERPEHEFEDEIRPVSSSSSGRPGRKPDRAEPEPRRARDDDWLQEIRSFRAYLLHGEPGRRWVEPAQRARQQWWDRNPSSRAAYKQHLMKLQQQLTSVLWRTPEGHQASVGLPSDVQLLTHLMFHVLDWQQVTIAGSLAISRVKTDETIKAQHHVSPVEQQKQRLAHYRTQILTQMRQFKEYVDELSSEMRQVELKMKRKGQPRTEWWRTVVDGWSERCEDHLRHWESEARNLQNEFDELGLRSAS